MSQVTIGSQAHKELFGREFIDTHAPYDVAALSWPLLDAESLERLRSLPFWDEAVSTEHANAAKVLPQAKLEHVPLLHEAVALQGYEEARHSALLSSLFRHCDIQIPYRPAPPLPDNITWAFLRTEYGE